MVRLPAAPRIRDREKWPKRAAEYLAIASRAAQHLDS
jgi:hypothetical protein